VGAGAEKWRKHWENWPGSEKCREQSLSAFWRLVLGPVFPQNDKKLPERNPLRDNSLFFKWRKCLMASILQILRAFRCPNRKEPCWNSIPVLQNPAVSLRTFRPPAVSVKSKSTDRRVLRRPGIFSQRNPHNTTPIMARTYDDNRDLRFSTPTESATLRPGPPATSRHPFPPQLSPLSDSHIAPGYRPFGLLRMSKNTQQRPLSSFRKKRNLTAG
jgi:hypothetical protein